MTRHTKPARLSPSGKISGRIPLIQLKSMIVQGTGVIPFGRVAEARREEGALRAGVWWDFPGLGLLRPFWKGSERSEPGV